MSTYRSPRDLLHDQRPSGTAGRGRPGRPAAACPGAAAAAAGSAGRGRGCTTASAARDSSSRILCCNSATASPSGLAPPVRRMLVLRSRSGPSSVPVPDRKEARMSVLERLRRGADRRPDRRRRPDRAAVGRHADHRSCRRSSRQTARFELEEISRYDDRGPGLVLEQLPHRRAHRHPLRRARSTGSPAGTARTSRRCRRAG